MSQNPWEIPNPPSNQYAGAEGWEIAEPTAQQPPVSADAQANPRKKPAGKKILAIIAAVVVVIAGGTAAYFVPGMLKPQAAMSYISAKDPGPDPFMDTPADPDILPQLEGAAMPWHTPPSGSVDGHDPNLYGGSGSFSVCDSEKLINNLSSNDELNRAFASGVGVNASDVPRFIHSLQPLILMQDTWVTNHGFSRGKATPFQSVLQRGTAVLVDAYGVPRVRCSCGNPLAEAWSGYTAPSAIESAWDGYDARKVATIYEADDSAQDFEVASIDTGFPEERTFDDSQLNDLDEVRGAVTDDTPMTTPRDMGVKPDAELLRGNGMAVAGTTGAADDKVRPAGGDRFGDFDKWVVSGDGGVREEDSASDEKAGFPDWRSETTEVSAEPFEVGKTTYGNHFLPFHNHGVGCFVDDEKESITCHIKSLLDTALSVPMMKRHNASNTWAGQIDMVQIAPGNSHFQGVPSNTDSPLDGYRTVPHLETGQSVKVGDFVCFNLESSMGCEAPESRFYVDNQGHVFVDDSSTSLGESCGEVTDKRSNQVLDVIVSNGAVDCSDALKTADQYANAVPDDGSWENKMQHFGEWSCHTSGNDGPEDDHKLGGCYSGEKLNNQFELHYK